MPELESMIEQKLIDQLIYGESQWTYREDLKTEADLWANFRYILEQNNKDRLNGEPLSDSEFEQVKNQLQFSSFYKAGEWLVGENGKVQVHVQRDTERLHLVVMNHEHIAGGSSVYEVINQYSALKTDDENTSLTRGRRFDVTLMINGLPMIHIELKNKQHSYMEAFNQIKKYISEGKFTGIFSAVQMFVVSNGADTRYFAAASDTELNPKFMSGWVDKDNNQVANYLDFAKSVLRIPEEESGEEIDQDYELMAYSNTKIDYEYIINLIQNIVTPVEEGEEISSEEKQRKIAEVLQYVEELRKSNGKVAEIMCDLIGDIEEDDTKYRGKSILNIVENMKKDCINTVIADFCSTWCASKDDVMYAAMHYRNGEIPNESAIKATVDYTKYKAGQEKPLPKFKYFSQMMAELRMILEEEIKPLLITV